MSEIKRYSINGKIYEDASGELVKLEDIKIEHFLNNEELRILFDSKKRASKIATDLISANIAHKETKKKLEDLQDAIREIDYWFKNDLSEDDEDHKKVINAIEASKQRRGE